MSTEHREQPERRRVPRMRPSELSYIELGADSGGLVRNASEEGLGFHAAVPVLASGPLRFYISPSPACRFELSGTVVWTDQSKKIGGLRFTNLSADNRELIRGWLAQSPAMEVASEEFTQSRSATEEEIGIGSSAKRQPVKELESKPVELWDVPPADAYGDTKEVRRSAFPKEVPYVPQFSVSRPRPLQTVLKGTLVTVLIAVLIVTAIVLGYSSRRQIGASLVHLGEKLQGNNDDVSVAPPLPNADTPSAQTPEKPVPSAPVQVTPETPIPQEIPSSQETVSKTYSSEIQSLPGKFKDRHSGRFKDRHLERSQSADAKQLWGTIGKGNIGAEVALAQLYLNGQGVPQNCEQARVLLRAASRRGSLEAAKLLQNLRSKGCR